MLSGITDFLYPFKIKEDRKYNFLGELYQSILPVGLDKATVDYIVRPDMAIYLTCFAWYSSSLTHMFIKDVHESELNQSDELTALTFGLIRAIDNIQERLINSRENAKIPELFNYVENLLFEENSREPDLILENPERNSLEIFTNEVRKRIGYDNEFKRYWEQFCTVWKMDGSHQDLESYITYRSNVGKACGDLIFFCLKHYNENQFGEKIEKLQSVSRLIGSTGDISDAFLDWEKDMLSGVLNFKILPLDKYKLIPNLIAEGIHTLSKLEYEEIPTMMGIFGVYIVHEIKEILRNKLSMNIPQFSIERLPNSLKPYAKQLGVSKSFSDYA